jgi:hypothetical protein
MKVFNIRLNYKSGIQEEFQFTKFESTDKGIEWISYGEKRPLGIGAENFESAVLLSTFEVADPEPPVPVIDDVPAVE